MPKSYTLRNFDGRKLSYLKWYGISLQFMTSISPGIQSNLKECTFVAAKKLWMPAWPTKKSITNQIGKRYLAYPFVFSNAVVCAKRLLSVAGEQRDANWRIHLGIQPSLVRSWSRLLVGNYSCPNNEGPADLSDGTPQVARGSMGSGSCLNIAKKCLS